MLKFLITAGPTREYLDSVRFFTNGSTGKMGYACVDAARAKGHQVTLITGPVHLTPPAGVQAIAVSTTAEMADAVFRHYDDCHVVIKTAAPCDYRPAYPSESKIKKGPDAFVVKFAATTDILRELGRRKTHQILIGFAVEDQNGKEQAQRKMKEKNLDAIVLNTPASFAADQTDFQVFLADGQSRQLPATEKSHLATLLISLAEELHASSGR